MQYYDKFQGLIRQKRYNVKNAISLAIACDLAYEDNDQIAQQVANWGFNLDGCIHAHKEPDIDTQCYIMSDNDNVVIVFRGSESIKDWLTNFQAVYDPGPMEGTKAHEGFQDALFPAVIGITNILDASIKNNNSGDKKLWITGHSLGGALCSLYAGMLIENAYPVYGIYTFASPRPGDGAFAQRLDVLG